jgi:hypothetical protein
MLKGLLVLKPGEPHCLTIRPASLSVWLSWWSYPSRGVVRLLTDSCQADGPIVRHLRANGRSKQEQACTPIGGGNWSLDPSASHWRPSPEDANRFIFRSAVCLTVNEI